jgi:methane/ammonia monooxygenase subunit B
MMKRLALVFLIGLSTMVLFTPAASAHGERSQEGFLRMRTVGWTDVVFAGGQRNAQGDIVVAQGEKFTIKGVAKLMDSWPDTLAAGEPEIGYINVATQGPCIGMLERKINGVSAPGRIEVSKGRYYSFEETFMGRRVGRWHVHPTFAVKGAGTLLGPGQWVRVTPAAFTSPVKLYNGSTINLENYELNMVWAFQVFGFLIGIVWMLWWTVPKWHRTVTNPAVTLQIPLNDDGVAVGLNSKKDHRFVNLMAIFTALFLLAGWIYQAAAYPVKIPQQVVQFEPPKTALDAVPALAEVNPQAAKYDYDSKVLKLEVDAKNVTSSPIELAQFVTSTLTFINPALGRAQGDYQAQFKLSPPGPIEPGQTQTLSIELPGDRFDQEHLLPTGESQLTISGLLVFKDGAGQTASAEFEEPLQPKFAA